MPRPSRLAADLALLAVAGAWGLTFPLGKIVLDVLPPFTYLVLRFSIASVVLGGLRAVMARAAVRAVEARGAAREAARTGSETRRQATGPSRNWLHAIGVGVVLFLAYAFQTVGLGMTTASKAGFITGLSVAMVPVISAVWLRRIPRAWVLAGVGAATVGLALLTLSESLAISAGDLLVLACAVCVAFHIVLVGRLAGALDPLMLATAQVIPVAALSALAALLERPLTAVAGAGPPIWSAIVFMALTGTVAAYLVQSWAQRFTSPSHTGLMFTFEPVAAALAAFLMLGEVFSGRQAWGAALILAGIVAAELGREAPGPTATAAPSGAAARKAPAGSQQ